MRTFEEFTRMQESQRAEGSLIGFKRAKEPAPDLFKEWARRREQAMREAGEKAQG